MTPGGRRAVVVCPVLLRDLALALGENEVAFLARWERTWQFALHPTSMLDADLAVGMAVEYGVTLEVTDVGSDGKRSWQ